MTNSSLKIKAIKTDIGYFIQGDGLERYFFDGLKLEPTYNKSWGKIKNAPIKIEKDTQRSNINYRYELIDKTLESKKFPLVFNREDVSMPDSDSSYNEWIWKDEFSQFKSLYELKFDTQPNIKVPVEFEFNICLEMDNIKEYGGFSYSYCPKLNWDDKFYPSITDKEVNHELIDTILFPDIILPAHKSQLTSKQTYGIIRKHIQDNINSKYAHITSDYDFCFKVKKKISLAEKISYQRDVSRYGAKKPKYITDYKEFREIEIFEMTYSSDRGYGGNHKGYTPIEGFKGNNMGELKENIDNYLKDLMDKINEPVVDCKHCKGKGVVLNNSVDNTKDKD
jgi:hypothetical protein